MPAGKLGSLAAPIYFLNMRDERYPVGYYILAPYSDFPTPEGGLRYTADDFAQVDRLQKILLDQELQRAEREHIRQELVMRPLRQKVRDRLYQTMTSGGTSQYEKDFIHDWFKLRDEKRSKHEQNFYHRNLYLHAREMDAAPNRQPNEEKVDLQRVYDRIMVTDG